MTTDTVLALFSCTKAITGVAAMQLVEGGRLNLDDPAREYVPEIAEIQVLESFGADGMPQVRPPKSDITVRQLLLHTAGFGYDLFSHDLVKYGELRNVPSVITGSMAALRSVLLFDPGTRREYGSSIDWAGKVVEAVRDQRLDQVMRERISEPLGMDDTGFKLSASMRPRRATIHQRGEDGNLTPLSDFELPQEPEVHMGGHGLYATVGDYMKFIRMVPNDGTGAHGRVLKPETVAMMAQNGLGPLKIKSLPGAMPSFSHEAEFFPGMPKSWGYSFMINDEQAPTGRPARWAGPDWPICSTGSTAATASAVSGAAKSCPSSTRYPRPLTSHLKRPCTPTWTDVCTGCCTAGPQGPADVGGGPRVYRPHIGDFHE
jgi:methyl acetate hydrolase